MKNLLVVESPAKAKTIGKYLGKDYDVVASYGHIRDLPSKNGSVDVNNDFATHYEVSDKSAKNVSEIVKRVKNCDKLILAPDPDREGESIAWHVLEVLKEKKAINKDTKIERVVFNAITKNSVLDAIKNPRQIDMDLVNAQQSRRILDYLVGFTLSPILWRKLPGSRSAGRVQSVALRIICDREDEIRAFKSEEYWDIKVDLNDSSKKLVTASLTHINNEKLEKFSIQNEAQAKEISNLLKNKSYDVIDIKEKDVKRRPYPPFMTSTLQQEAARKLGFSTKKTMQIAQKLYEGLDIGGNVQGLITYMRTDGIYVAPEAINIARKFIEQQYGEKYLPQSAIIYKSKVKNAQEAHEAIRPTDPSLSPQKLANYLEKDYLALYSLIWKRMIASQMSDIILKQVTVTIKTNPDYAHLRVSGSVVKFDGFSVLYNETNEDEDDESEDKKLPDLKLKDKLDLVEVRPNQHFTEPPPRYSEASLVQKMEELSIGRPSTYATIISVLQDRDYVKLDKKRFIPQERGMVVTAFLKEFFSYYVQYDYTAKLEDDLDDISNGKLRWKEFLKNFWVGFNQNTIDVSKKTIPDILEKLNKNLAPSIFGVNEDGSYNNKCDSCNDGILGIKIGKFGVFVGCSNYPNCKNTKHLSNLEDEAVNSENNQNYEEPKLIGNHSKSAAQIFLKKGPYGFYIEMEDLTSAANSKTKKPKPKRVSVPKNIAIDEIDVVVAEKLLSLPRDVGIHPDSGLMIKASIGPFGPYLLHDGKYSSVKEDDILEIGLNRAVIVIAEDLQKKANKVNTKPNRAKSSTKKSTSSKISKKKK